MGGGLSRDDKMGYFSFMLETDMTQRYLSVLELVRAKSGSEENYHRQLFNKARLFFIQNQQDMPAHVRSEIEQSGNLQAYMKRFSHRRFQEIMFGLAG